VEDFLLDDFFLAAPLVVARAVLAFFAVVGCAVFFVLFVAFLAALRAVFLAEALRAAFLVAALVLISESPMQHVEVQLEALGIFAIKQPFALTEAALAFLTFFTVAAAEPFLNHIANLARWILAFLK